MATTRLSQPESAGRHRADAVRDAIGNAHEGDLDEGLFEVLAMTVAETSAARDTEGETLRLLADELDRLIAELDGDGDGEENAEARGRLLAYRDVVHWTLQRAISDTVVADLNPYTHAYRFLRLVDERPGMSNSDLLKRLGVSESEVSRVGRRVYGAGLAQKRRIGGMNYWESTPRGKRALEVAAQRFDLPVKKDTPHEVQRIFADAATVLVGALLEARGESRETNELEARLATSTGEILKGAGIEVDEQPDLAIRFLDDLDSELSDIRSVVNGSKHLVENDATIVVSGLEDSSARVYGGLLSSFEVTPRKALGTRGKVGLRLAKADDGTWLLGPQAGQPGVVQQAAKRVAVGPPAAKRSAVSAEKRKAGRRNP